MKLKSDHRPELAVSGDAARSIQHLYLDTAAGKLVATNGHMLVAVPVAVDKDDHDGLISADAIRHARKVAPRRGDAQVRANGSQVTDDGATFARPHGDFPPYKQIIPSEIVPGAAHTVTIGLDAGLLAKLAKAIGHEQVAITVAIRAMSENRYSAPLDPMRVTSVGTVEDDDPVAFLMPCRVK